ncbi:MAG: hypothetical protein RL754_170 [Bacteroidota bacterium]|jgi:S-adenosylmethionine:tRNA ribosyltransferase-isomerase
MIKADFIYDLPDERIAAFPLEQRDESKLLVYRNGGIEDRTFRDLPSVLSPKSQLIFNNTRVVKARLHFTKTEGAKPIEIFCLTPHQQSVEDSMNASGRVKFECLVGNLKRWKDHPLSLALGDGLVLQAEKIERHEAIWIIQFTWNGSQTFADVLELAGKIPLPPYMNREAEDNDVDRYQTVYAASNGSVAAPTAGLHFTDRVFEDLKGKGHQTLELTLHVGAGTFKPMSDGAVDAHEMHAEEIIVSRNWLQRYLSHQGPKFAVGTTSLRTLESCHWIGAKLIEGRPLEDLGQFDAYDLPQTISTAQSYTALLHYLEVNGLHSISLKTQLMIRPGYTFKSVGGIITNFHQPGSTLLLLVSAGVGEHWHSIYAHALANNYRFLSYGDSSLLYFSEEPQP